jgi:hypothetical protein
VESIVSDGRKRLERSADHRARVHELKLEIEARYVERSRHANILERVVLRVQMKLEFRRERAKLEPSQGALFLER